MKRFLLTILTFIVVPLILLASIYLWTDPFRCIHDFDINDVDVTNREYMSTELFLRNNPTCHFNSFIFSSSRGGGMNTFQWKQYLPEGASPFLFQAWSESLTGIELKMNYLNENRVPINNALILLDIPSSFTKSNQLPHDALSMKHYLFTGHTKLGYNAMQYFNFIQSPSLWVKSIKNRIGKVRVACESDTITNDWERSTRYHYSELPPQDSLKQCSEITRHTSFEKMAHSNKIVAISEPLITEQFESQIRHIKSILDANQTDYHIIITPAPCYTSPSINPNDLAILQSIFGIERVHDYSGKNEFTEDYNNFSDPGHFGLRVGYLIIEDIYKPKKPIDQTQKESGGIGRPDGR
jgi:hypothetical protein